jgi:transposase
MKITRIGIDLAKQVFQIHGVDRDGKVAVRRQLRRQQMMAYFSVLDPCLIGMEACGSAHHWARELGKMGHTVKLMAPHFVKPYVKSGKNDANDAEAICEAVGRPTMRFVTIKTVEQQVMQAAHRIRSRLIRARTALANEIRGLLAELGVVLPAHLSPLRRSVPDILEDAENALMADFRVLLHELWEELRALDEQIAQHDARLQAQAKTDERVRRLMAIEGLGVISATALVCAVGDGKQFKAGREMAAWLGLTPSQHSSGGKSRLGHISKRGDCYVRTLLIHGARAALLAAKTKQKQDGRSRWVTALAERRNVNIATVALANKNARIAWALLVRDEDYRRAA